MEDNEKMLNEVSDINPNDVNEEERICPSIAKKLDQETIQILLDDRISTGG
jgi:hypothetical protein